jgi:opacity protein-like surface antigen
MILEKIGIKNFCKVLVMLFLLISLSNIIALGDSLFYIGGSLDAFNAKQNEIPVGYDYTYLNDGFQFGFGLNFGINLTDSISFPDITGKIFRMTYKEEYWGGNAEEREQLQYILTGIGMKYRVSDYRLQPFFRVGVFYENIRFKEIRDYYDEDRDDIEITDFVWGFAPYIGAGLSYYINDDMALGLELVYSNGRGTFKTGEHETYSLGGTDISSSFTWYPF